MLAFHHQVVFVCVCLYFLYMCVSFLYVCVSLLYVCVFKKMMKLIAIANTCLGMLDDKNSNYDAFFLSSSSVRNSHLCLKLSSKNQFFIVFIQKYFIHDFVLLFFFGIFFLAL